MKNYMNIQLMILNLKILNKEMVLINTLLKNKAIPLYRKSKQKT